MFLYKELYKHVFDNRIEATQLNIITGYIGPSVIEYLLDKDIEVNIYIGMYNNGVDPILHKRLQLYAKNPHINIFYTKTAIHSKCYIWAENDVVVKSLVGSANFSSNGLFTDYKETLSDVDEADFESVRNYLEIIERDSTKVDSTSSFIMLKPKPEPILDVENMRYVECVELSLLATKTGTSNILGIRTVKEEVPTCSGLNWGFSNAMPQPNDAYIAIPKNVINHYPGLIPPKESTNIPIDVIWDDGETMQMLMEGNVDVNGISYPKQISSYKNNTVLGLYLRKRIGDQIGKKLQLPLISKDQFKQRKNEFRDKLIRKSMLDIYGRTSISIRRIDEHTYYFNFEAVKNEKSNQTSY